MLPLAPPRGQRAADSATPGPPRHLTALLVAAGTIGLVAAVVLLVEKIALIADPTYVPSCSINPVLSCGSVMNTPQADAFGFPNPIIGVAGFAILLTVGMGLAAGGRYRRWFWLGLQAGVTFGAGFVHWLIFQSLYRIEALCPYCMVVWAVTIPVFWYTTLHNLSAAHLPAPRVLRRVLLEYHGVLLTGWYLVILTLIGAQFWTYWQTLLP
ncbi:vitamin K epoxide reductase family protein [Georgenia sp. Z1344]|uniref:vitamin K epoxide reductase family protein n=1 Tax=Georgenia sp. Z1344 TaxID=3416706 RepID=UPI003CF96A63